MSYIIKDISDTSKYILSDSDQDIISVDNCSCDDNQIIINPILANAITGATNYNTLNGLFSIKNKRTLIFKNLVAGNNISLNSTSTGITINSTGVNGNYVSGTTFNYYTGTTAPNTYQTKTSINTLTGTTLPAAYQSKASINTYTGTTAPSTYQTKASINTLTGTTLPLTYQSKSSIDTLTGTTLPNTYQSKSSIVTFTGTTLPNTYVNKTNYNAFTAITVTTANNGLTKIGNNVRLGGALTGTTSISAGTYKNLAASTEYSDLIFNMSRTVGFTGGGKTLQRAIRISAPTYTASTATVIQRATTLSIAGPPTGSTNITINNAHALDIENGRLKVGSYTPGSGGTATIHTTGEVRAAGGFNLRSPVNNDNSQYGMYFSGSLPALVEGNAAVVKWKNIGGATGSNASVDIISSYNPTAGSGANSWLKVSGSFVGIGGTVSPTGILIQPALQPGGTWSGTYTGLDYNPTLGFTSGITGHYGLLIRPVASKSGFGLNATLPTASVDIAASTTTQATLRIRSGTAPTSPNDGDIWYDGTDLKIRIGGTTKTFNLT